VTKRRTDREPPGHGAGTGAPGSREAREGGEPPQAAPPEGRAPKEAGAPKDDSGDRDFKARSKPLLRLAKKGDSTAQYKLARLFLNAPEPFRDSRKALRWFRASAGQGCFPACLEAGKMLLSGDGVKRSPKKGFELIRLSAKNYEPAAFFPLAELYRRGGCTRKSKGEAFLWTLRAAETGDPRAFLPLGWDYFLGRGVARDLGQAAAWALRTAEDDLEALRLLVELIEMGADPAFLLEGIKQRLAANAKLIDRKTFLAWKKVIGGPRARIPRGDQGMPTLFPEDGPPGPPLGEDPPPPLGAGPAKGGGKGQGIPPGGKEG
jgi:hypothetical protein